jgi:hypothetical protein
MELLNFKSCRQNSVFGGRDRDRMTDSENLLTHHLAWVKIHIHII